MNYEDGPMHCGGWQHKDCPDDRCLIQCTVCGAFGRHESGMRCFALKYPELQVVTLDVVRDECGNAIDLIERKP